MSNQQIPIACNMNALPDREKHLKVGAELMPQMQLMTEFDTGYTLNFPVNQLLLVAEFVNGERLCCPFIHFQIEIIPQADKVQLHVSGGEDVKTFLKAEFLPYLTSSDN